MHRASRGGARASRPRIRSLCPPAIRAISYGQGTPTVGLCVGPDGGPRGVGVSYERGPDLFVHLPFEPCTPEGSTYPRFTCVKVNPLNPKVNLLNPKVNPLNPIVNCVRFKAHMVCADLFVRLSFQPIERWCSGLKNRCTHHPSEEWQIASFNALDLYWRSSDSDILWQEQQLHRNVQRFRGGLVFKAHRLLCHSTLGLRAIKKVLISTVQPNIPRLRD